MKFSLLKLLVLAILPVVISSCKIEKRLHRPGYHVEWKKPLNKRPKELKVQREKTGHRVTSFESAENRQATNEGSRLITEKADPATELYADINNQITLSSGSSVRGERFIQKHAFQEECEVLVMTDGRELEVKLLEISQTEIKYRKCNYPDGPIVILDKDDVDRVLYANGAVDIISGYSAPNESTQRTPQSGQTMHTVEKKMDVLALLSMIFAIVGVFIAGLPLGIAAVVMAIISLSKFARFPDRFAGKGMAIAGLIIGILAIVGALVVISMAA